MKDKQLRETLRDAGITDSVYWPTIDWDFKSALDHLKLIKFGDPETRALAIKFELLLRYLGLEYAHEPVGFRKRK